MCTKLPDTTICVSARYFHDFLFILVTHVAGCQLSLCCMERGVLGILEGYISDTAAYRQEFIRKVQITVYDEFVDYLHADFYVSLLVATTLPVRGKQFPSPVT